MLLAYTKDTNAAVVLASDLPDDPYVQRELVRYFPSALRERFAEVMGGHRLRREIVATDAHERDGQLRGARRSTSA